MKAIKNLLIKLLSVALAVSLCLITASCTPEDTTDDTPQEPVGCQHTYSDYFFNATKHYKRAICDCYNVPFSSEGEHDLVDGKCSVCNYQESEGLEFQMNSNNSSYTLIGRGTCKDEYVSVPGNYQGFPVTAISSSAFRNDANLIGVVLPLGITSIPSSCFSGCTSLKIASLPEGVKKLGSSAFSGSGIEYIDLPSTVIELGHGAFYNCMELEEIYIPDKCEKIVKGCFSNCRNLKRVVFGEKVSFIGVRAFNSCNQLKEVHIKSIENWLQIQFTDSTADNEDLYNINPLSLTEVNSRASVFVDGVLLEELVIPNGVEKIGRQVLPNVKTLKKLVIPTSVTEIGIFAFLGASALTEIEYEGTIAEWGQVTKKPAWVNTYKTNVVKCSDGEVRL